MRKPEFAGTLSYVKLVSDRYHNELLQLIEGIKGLFEKAYDDCEEAVIEYDPSYSCESWDGVGYSLSLGYELLNFNVPHGQLAEEALSKEVYAEYVKIHDIFHGLVDSLNSKIHEASRRWGTCSIYLYMSHTIEKTTYLHVSCSAYIPKGYFICPECPNGQDVVFDVPDSCIELEGLRVPMCPNTFEHGNIYFIDSPLLTLVNHSDPPNVIDEGKNIILELVNPADQDHRRIVRTLNMYAKAVEPSFRLVNYDLETRIYLVLAYDGYGCGYVYWNNGPSGERVLRQIMLMEKFCGQGYGTLIMRKTIELESKGELFGIEDPNEISQRILEKLGYLKKDSSGNYQCHGCVIY